MNAPVVVLLLVFILIAVRRIGKTGIGIWQVMLAGALVVLLTGQISPVNALGAINPDVMLFLFGMFVIGQALHESSYLQHLSYKTFGKAKTTDQLVLMILFGIGGLSAFLMNDTLAIICTPLVLYFAKKHGISPKLMLLSLAFAVTTGSVMSPIGNPQNLLISITGNISDPFVTFFKYLFLPTMINLFLAYVILKAFYKEHFLEREMVHYKEPIRDAELALLSKVSLVLIFALVAGKIILAVMGTGADFKLTYIALVSAFPVMLSRKRFKVMRNIDWHTLIFFASMFVLMESVWESGFFQTAINEAGADLASIPAILAASVIVSQLISNVPFVALCQPLITSAGASANGIMALAAGSTIAGNLSIMGAASNIIIIQNAEKNGETLTFIDFVKVGVPLTIANVLVYWIFLSVM
ncbi:MAG: anion transporter [Candidatus Altiarchaeales archaeon IMC4]|nr:MAG: anion transporter [Candidatus Altiarchaeales archaeon IMC4]